MSGRAQFIRARGSFLPDGLLLWLLLLQLHSPARAELPTTNAVQFFNHLSSRLLQREFGLPLQQIQIYPTNQYTPAVHRLLQVAANLWETTPDSPDNLPTVFRPRFGVSNNVVFICDYVLVTNASDLAGLPLLDLTATPNAPALIPPSGDALIFGVPLVIGARQGLPNFNEFSMETEFQLSRKVQLVKAGAPGAITQTNQFFVMSLTVPMGVEFWNSYASNYTRSVSIRVTNHCSVSLTNDLGVNFTANYVMGDSFSTNDWPKFTAQSNNKSFLVLLRTNLPALPIVGYLPNLGANGFVSPTNVALFDTSQELLAPRWGFAITNRIHARIVDDMTGQIIDYVLLGGMSAQTNLTDVFSRPLGASGDPFEQLWCTNTLPSGKLSGRIGVLHQILISRGAQGGVDLSDGRWRSYGVFTPSSVDAAVANFNAFMNSTTPGTNTVPFTPAFRFSIPMLWQANDPLVHSLSDELFNREKSGGVRFFDPPSPSPQIQLENLGYKNDRYRPWQIDPGAVQFDPHAYDPAVKDPLATSSSAWTFPTNAPLSAEILGRIHRGTPWQTLYLKAAAASPLTWQNWSGHAPESAAHTHPTNDWSLVAFIQTLLNTNSPRDLLSVNEPNLNHWQDTLDGLVVLTNISTELQLALGQAPVFASLSLVASSAEVTAVLQSLAALRATQPGQVFRNPGNWLATPELSSAAPWLNQSTDFQRIRGLTDEAYEQLPSQLLARLREDSVGSIQPGSPPTIQFTGSDDFPYAVETSTNLVNWISVSTNYPSNGVFEFALPPVSGTNRFYRSTLLP